MKDSEKSKTTPVKTSEQKEQVKVCTMCGKELDFWDLENKNHIKHYISYGSKYDLSVIEFDLCNDCLDKVLDTILPMFKTNPLKDYDVYQSFDDPHPYIEETEKHNKRVGPEGLKREKEFQEQLLKKCN